MKRVRILISVISDLDTDQRIQKVASSLQEHIGDVTVICRKGNSKLHYPYQKKGIRLFFRSGFLFYAEFNIRLFCKLFWLKSDILVANDVDTLLPNMLLSFLKRKAIVFDSHEIMSQVPEVIARPRVQKVWQWIETTWVPRVPYKYTVCKSLKKHYNHGFSVVRNVPYRLSKNELEQTQTNKKIILYQGAINMGRGIETMISALPFLDGIEFWIVGNGYEMNSIKQLVQEKNVADKVIFKGRILPEYLPQITQQAHLGISIEENIGLNYYYALPNKLMDYVQAEVPVLVSNFPEMSQIVNTYNIGEVIENREPADLAQQIRNMLFDDEKNSIWKKNLKHAAKELCWEKEEEELLNVYKKVLEHIRPYQQ